MSDRPDVLKRVVVTAVEVLLVAALVLALGYGGMHWAEARHARPVGPGGDGSIRLEIRQSDWRGSVEVVEANYVGAWRCEGDWELRWRFAATTPDRYDVAIEVGCPEKEAGGEVEIVVGEQVLRGVVPDTGSWWQWKPITIGQVSLDTSPHTLVLRPSGPSASATMNFNNVILKPFSTSSDAAPPVSRKPLTRRFRSPRRPVRLRRTRRVKGNHRRFII